MMLQRGVPEKVSTSAEPHTYQRHSMSHGRADYSTGNNHQPTPPPLYISKTHDSQMSSMKQRQQNTFVIKIQHESGGLMEEREKFPAAHLELRAQG